MSTREDGLTHLDQDGRAHMVDVTAKAETRRVAIAEGRIEMAAETLDRIVGGRTAKGDPIQIAELAGIMAAKQTPSLIPMCHPLNLSAITIDFEELDDSRIKVSATVKVTGKTGVEMEALVACTNCALHTGWSM